MNGNDFLERYKGFGNTDLLDIVDNAKDYQPLAVEAAQLERDYRQLSAEHLSEAKMELNIRRQDKANKQQKVNDIENKVKSVGYSLLDNLNPIQKNAPTTDKYINLISLFLGGFFLYSFYNELGLLQFMFTEEIVDWDFGTILIFLPWIILPTAAILFWFRRKHGWTLTTLFFSYTLTGVTYLFLMELNRKPTGMPLFDTLFPITSPTVYIGTFVFFGGLISILCKPEIREIYGIDKQAMLITIGSGAGIALLITFALL
jgi:hypothetical protein